MPIHKTSVFSGGPQQNSFFSTFLTLPRFPESLGIKIRNCLFFKTLHSENNHSDQVMPYGLLSLQLKHLSYLHKILLFHHGTGFWCKFTSLWFFTLNPVSQKQTKVWFIEEKNKKSIFLIFLFKIDPDQLVVFVCKFLKFVQRNFKIELICFGKVMKLKVTKAHC